jgi:hypothetical protein
MTRIEQKRAQERLRAKALLPEERYCRILRKRITVLVEYEDYRNPHNKGPEGTLYCENIVECYQSNVQCRYSGISPSYPDPFAGVPRDVREAEALFAPPAAQPDAAATDQPTP